MPRRHDDYEPTPRKKSNTGMILALALGGAALVGLVVVGGCFALFYSAKGGAENIQTKQEAAEKATVKTTVTREEFRVKVMGKTPEQVIAVVGKPSVTQDHGGDPIWYYNEATTDPVSGKVDYHAQVIFENGRVIAVNF